MKILTIGALVVALVAPHFIEKLGYKRQVHVLWDKAVSGFVLYENTLIGKKVLGVEFKVSKVYEDIRHHHGLIVFDNEETRNKLERRKPKKALINV